MITMDFISKIPPEERRALVQQLRGVSLTSTNLADAVESGDSLTSLMLIAGWLSGIALTAAAIQNVSDRLNVKPAADDPEWQLDPNATI